jgi:hypothetical protein
MEIEIKCQIEIPGGGPIEMTPKEVLKFHDDLTKFINDNWEALKEKD